MLCPSDAVNKAAETDVKYKDWSAKLIHVSGFANFLSPAIQDWVMPADIVIVQRNVIIDGVLDAMRYFQGMGKPCAVDLDDAYHMLPWSNPAHRFWIENTAHLAEPPIDILEKALALSDGLIAPNRLLLSDWQHATRGYYVPNYARGQWWMDLPTRAELKAKLDLGDRIVIGWGGSVSHYDSWWGSGLREAATRISAKHPRVTWLICGNDPRVYQMLPVPSDQKRLQPGVLPQEWPKIVQSFDVGVAPLFGPYDQRRSWIKGLEYGLAGVPWIGTIGEPYRDLNGLGYQIGGGIDEWCRALDHVLSNLESEQARAVERIPHFRQWLVENQLDNLAQVYQQIIADFRTERGQLPGVNYVNWETSDLAKIGRDAVIA